MIPGIIEIKDLKEAQKEISAVGCEKAGTDIMAPKAVTRIIKLKGVRPIAANIIKQEMLSFGGEAATAYGALNHSVKTTDVLLIGTLKQLRQLVAKMKQHQFNLPQMAKEISLALNNYDRTPPSIKIGPRTLDFGRRTYVMGILNLTPDSFSDGGKYSNVEAAVVAAEQMWQDGADIIDVGGESTRPGSKPVPIKEEIKRVVPVIRALAKKHRMAISIDTRKSEVAKAALEAGAQMINDVSGLRFDKKMAKVAVKYKVPICLMHMRKTPATMQKNIAYSDLMGEIIEYLAEGIAIANGAGILPEQIILDPGLGFGKMDEHNLEIVRKLRQFKVLGRPILVGPSRKATIGRVLNLPARERVEGTAAMVAAAILNGANIVRVHDVKEMVRVARTIDAIMNRRGRD